MTTQNVAAKSKGTAAFVLGVRVLGDVEILLNLASRIVSVTAARNLSPSFHHLRAS